MPERTECICTSKDITECSWPKYGNNRNAHQQENRYIYYRIVIQWDTTQQQQKKAQNTVPPHTTIKINLSHLRLNKRSQNKCTMRDSI